VKSFDRLREQSLEEKLKSSDPTGKWISDFVHSDNPKFAGKSKKERIRMALGASYGAKRNEEVELDEAAWGKDKMTNLKAAHDRHSEKAIAANKAGDDSAVKVHQSKMNMLKNQMNKLRKEDVEQLDEIGDTPAGQKMLKKVDSRAFYKAGTKSGGKGNMADAGEKTLERTQARIKKQPSLLSKAAGAVKKVFTREEVEQIGEEKHRVQVTVSEPDHQMVTRRKEKQQKFLRVSGDKEKAVAKAQQHYKKQGYKVHGAEYVSSVNEEVIGEAKIKVNFKMPSEHLSDKLARRQSELRKKSGLPDPSHYQNIAAQKKKELGEGSIEGGAWTSKSPKKGQPEVDPPSAIVEPIDKNAKDTTTIKPGLGDLNKVFDKIDRENAAKAKKPVKEYFKFSDIRSNLAEVKKMKGEDPCWDDYKMIGTKMKNGKQVPNCVPKESVAEGKEEQEYDYEGDMAMSDLRSILHNAKTVHDMLEPNTNIPEWCQSKITLAEDYISTVANYMRGEMSEEVQIDEAKPGLYANIHAKRKRIKGGSGERMRKPGAKGAPTAQAFRDSAKTAKK
jgi:hypothetical protein